MSDTQTTQGDVKSVFLFPNNMLAVCGHDGKQIPELQGEFSLDLMRAIKARSDHRTEWNGVRP